MAGLKRIVTRHAWWLVATASVAGVVAVVLGWWLFPVYALANAAGTVLFLDGFRGRAARERRLVLPLMTVAMIPVGVLVTLGWRRTDLIDIVLGDEDVRNHTAAANVYGERRHMGAP